MGLINREDTAPITAGDDMLASEVELEFAKLFDVINGNLDNSNLASNAAIVGSKLAAASVTGDRIASNTITTAQMAASAVTKASVETATATGGNVAFTTSATYVDADGFSGVSVTPGSANDMIFFDFTCAVDDDASGTGVYMFGVSIGGSDTDLQEVTINTTNSPQIIHIAHMVAAGGTSAVTVKPRYKKLSGASSGQFIDDSLRIARTVIFPIK